MGKAAGPDDIPPEVFKSCDVDEICLEFCNDALIKNDKPDLWLFMDIIPIPKSGDLSKTITEASPKAQNQSKWLPSPKDHSGSDPNPKKNN